MFMVDDMRCMSSIPSITRPTYAGPLDEQRDPSTRTARSIQDPMPPFPEARDRKTCGSGDVTNDQDIILISQRAL